MFSGSLTESAVATISGTESFDQAPRELVATTRLRTQILSKRRLESETMTNRQTCSATVQA